MSSAPGISDGSVLLRALSHADLETLRGFVNDPDVMQFSNTYGPVDDAAQQRWYQGLSANRSAVWFGICELIEGKDRLVGTCCLVDVDWVSRVAELRIRIGDRAAWSRGLGGRATRLLLGHGFAELNLQRIWLRVFDSNVRASRLYERLGFKIEGRLRQAVFLQGAYQDVLLMGLLRSEWQDADRPC